MSAVTTFAFAYSWAHGLYMLTGLPRDASVCIQCRLRISYLLLPKVPYSLRPRWSNARRQSTAAAVLEESRNDVREDRDDHSSEGKPKKEFDVAAFDDDTSKNIREDQKKHPPPKKPKKGLRRIWKPPPVAELGVSSLGKPAEVLVLKDRDRHVPPAADDEAERPKTSEPRILEALQAESLPLSSENVEQSLHQISAPYRNRSGALSAKELAQLRKKIIDGFTQGQLQAYCFGDDRSRSNSPSSKEASSVISKTQTIPGMMPARTTRNKTLAVNLKPLKAALVDYILKDKWAMAIPDDEQRKIGIPVAGQKLEYIARYQQPLLKAYAEQFDVAIDASKQDGRILIGGKSTHISAAQSAVSRLCQDIQTSHVRSVLSRTALEEVITSAFRIHLSETYNVMIEWASKRVTDISEQEDRLTLCYHKTLDEQNALNVERAILLAERDLLLAEKRILPTQNISMWVSDTGLKPALVLHQVPEESNSSTGWNAWYRWVTPQPPLQIGKNGREKESQKDDKRLKAVKRQVKTLIEKLKGQVDIFFPPMPLKQQRNVNNSIKKDRVREEIDVNLGKILFPRHNKDVAAFSYLEEVFITRYENRATKLVTMREPASTILSPDLPGVPYVLNSLSPFDPKKHTAEVERKKYRLNYRLRYVPVPSQLPPGVQAAAIEIHVLRNGKPGSAVTNHITSACAILDEQFHKLLVPSFAVDLEFARRLRDYFTVPGQNNKIRPSERWLTKYEERIQKSDSDQFPQFMKVVLPGRAVKGDSSRAHRQKANEDSAMGVGTTDTPSDLILTAEDEPGHLSQRKFDYMLESSELIHSKTYNTKNLCLEHLDLERMPHGGCHQLLRLGVEPLLECSGVANAAMPKLLEYAFKIAAQISDPSIWGSLEQEDISATKTDRKKAVNVLGKDA